MKRIITCSDGTWNKPNMTYDGQIVRTNVQLIFEYISKSAGNIMQLKHYDAGVGAEGSWWTRMFSGATGDGIDANILAAYKFISWNYEEGDEIYLFGFSRGAYTARSLAGLIRKCGVIMNNDLNVFDNAYAMYRDKSTAPDSEKAMAFRTKYSYSPNIKFIGVWDTVGAMGIPLNIFQWYNKMYYSFYDTTLSSSVDYAYHALAIDEKRSNFKPTLWQPSLNTSTRTTPQVLEQRWFAGTHSNVGGGYPDTGLSSITLKWMIDKAAATGLGFDQGIVSAIKGNSEGELYDSRTGIFYLLPDYTRPVAKDAFVNLSVDDRIKAIPAYRPNNRDYF